MIKKINYRETDFFKKDLKKLKKRFKTLDDDIRIAKKNAIELFHLHGIDNQSVVLIPKSGNEQDKIYKMRKFACRSLKGRGVQSGIRIIYAYRSANETVELIEIYFKADNKNEDRDRIDHFLKNQQ